MKRYVVIAFLLLLGGLMLKEIIERQEGSRQPATKLNAAEEKFLAMSGRKAAYPQEKLPVIETANVCELGKLTALTFIHWVQDNPNGVIALPTGKTPELFIEYLKFYKNNWNEDAVQADLQHFGIDSEAFPETKNLKFVQLDEFFPIDTAQHNSFTHYVGKYYLSLLEIPEENVLGMDFCRQGVLDSSDYETVFPQGKFDLALLTRQPVNETEKRQKEILEKVDLFCENFEKQVKEWGGIGFFLGGIGPDGHIAFNMPGSEKDSKTRLVQLNYPTAASAAGDLGGIEHSRDKAAVTIGLKTITQNPNATILIIAAGEAKAPAVKNALERESSLDYPATALHSVNGARFYLTKGAASLLEARRIEDVQGKKWDDFSTNEVDDVVIDLALKKQRRIVDMTEADFNQDPRGEALLASCPLELAAFLDNVRQRLTEKIERGMEVRKGQNVLHTGPHHDDVMLSYHPLMCSMLGTNTNTFCYLTSGFNSVTNSYMVETLNALPESMLHQYQDKVFGQSHEEALKTYLKEVARYHPTEMKRAEEVILLQNIASLYDIKDMTALKDKVRWLKTEYFARRRPGEKDIAEVQTLKGSMRETESERMLMLAGVDLADVYHMRAKFYNGDYFNPLPSIEEDARPLANLYKELQPHLITVAYDPEGTGPDTHYKVLQIVAQALRMTDFDHPVTVWGYRNVWHRFKFSDGNTLYPVSEEEMAAMNHAFLSCFSTQRQASFPSVEHDGPFSELAEKIQREYFDNLQVLLGKKYFQGHPDPRVRNAQGFVFVKEMTAETFMDNAQELKSRIELVN